MNKASIEQKDEQSIKFNSSYLPLSMVNPKTQVTIKFIRGKDETRKLLSNLGFVQNAVVEVVSKISGNIIVNVKGSKVGIGQSMANKIITSFA